MCRWMSRNVYRFPDRYRNKKVAFFKTAGFPGHRNATVLTGYVLGLVKKFKA